MDEFQSKLNKSESILRSYSLININTTGDLGKASCENNRLYSPLSVQRHGRPPKTRKVSVGFMFPMRPKAMIIFRMGFIFIGFSPELKNPSPSPLLGSSF